MPPTVPDPSPAPPDDTPLVSILVPCWGCERYIAETIRSALAQSYPAIEVVVVEDCGTDGTYEAALRFTDPRVRVYRNAVNLGQFGNKNECAARARGALLKYLDGDDLLAPGCVATLVRAWRAAGPPGVGVVFGNYDVIDADGAHVLDPRRWGVSGRCDGRAVFREMMLRREAGSHFGNPSPHLIDAAVFRAVGGFPADHSWVGDWEFFLKVLCVSDAVFVDERVASYRVHGASISATTRVETSLRDNLKTVDRLAAWMRALPDPPAEFVSERAVREWKVWQNGDRILAHWLRRLRRQQNAWDAVAAVYAEAGLTPELRRFVRRTVVPFVVRALRHKVRRRLGTSSDPDLLDPRRVQRYSTRNER